MKDYIFLEWSYDNNNYICIDDFNVSSNLRFLIDYLNNDYKKNDQNIFVKIITMYQKTFVFNDHEKNIMYIGPIESNIDISNINEKNSCKISYENFIEIVKGLTRIEPNQAPFLIIYREDDYWISCRTFRFKEDIELFVQIMNEKLPLLRKEIDNIFLQMQLCSDVMQASSYFEQLVSIHSILCELVFIEEFDVTSDFRKFITDFDRIDDLWWRGYIFNKIKTENYSLEGESAMNERFKVKL